MEEIDEEMRQSNIPIQTRQFAAVRALRGRLGVGMVLLSDLPDEPRPGVYEGRDLTKRVFDWIEKRYGNRLKIYFGPGHTVIAIRGDAYRVILPLVIGKFKLVCDPNSVEARQPNNALTRIKDLSPSFARCLTMQELALILDQISQALIKLAQIAAEPPPALHQNAKSLVKHAPK